MSYTYVKLYVASWFEYIISTYKAVCPDGCFNGGVCTAPGTCTCSSGWNGNDCTQGKNFKY